MTVFPTGVCPQAGAQVPPLDTTDPGSAEMATGELILPFPIRYDTPHELLKSMTPRLTRKGVI
jgi:hypothetical protein